RVAYLSKNSIMERWIQACRHELLDPTLIWNHAHLLHAPREYATITAIVRIGVSPTPARCIRCPNRSPTPPRSHTYAPADPIASQSHQLGPLVRAQPTVAGLAPVPVHRHPVGRVPSLIPKSRATAAIDLPVSRTIRTAPSRNSGSNLRLVSPIARSFS